MKMKMKMMLVWLCNKTIFIIDYSNEIKLELISYTGVVLCVTHFMHENILPALKQKQIK